MADNPIQPENKPPQKPPTRIIIKPALKKAETARIDLSTAKPPQSIVDKKDLPANADDYFKRSTMRIEMPGAESKSATARIEISQGDSAKKQTAKIDLSQAKEAKAKTAPIGIPVAAPAAPARPIRPAMAALKRPVAVPGESNIIMPVATPAASDQARKSETARIDLKPEDLEKTTARPKTIRIKRPDGTSGRKPLAIARPGGQAAAEIQPGGETAPAAAAPSAEEGPGLLAGISAIAALIVVGVLFYVLMAQTIALDLPFPGKI